MRPPCSFFRVISAYTMLAINGSIYPDKKQQEKGWRKMVVYSLAAVLGAAVILVFIMWRQAYQNRVLQQTLYFPDFPESFGEMKIFFISDIHRRTIADRIINFTIGKADIVIIGGDLREGGISLKQVEENIRQLKKIGPLYFVWGNNDYEGDYHALDAMLLEKGVKILDNTAVSFESSEGDRLSLMGVDDMSDNRAKLTMAVEDSEQVFRILVSHNPEIRHYLKEEQSIKLVLSGHTHGGQIRIFGYGPYKAGGIEKQGDTLLLTSNGYGTSGVPLRLGAKPETHLLILKKGDSQPRNPKVHTL